MFAIWFVILPINGIPAHAVVAQTFTLRSPRVDFRTEVRRVSVTRRYREWSLSVDFSERASLQFVHRTPESTHVALSGETVLDGEIVSVWTSVEGRSFVTLFHRGEPCFYAFDLLMSDGKDLRTERLTDRKHELRRLLSKVPEPRMRYVEHVEHHGTALFERVCKLDMEGIVAKHGSGPYVTEAQRTTWFKIKNRSYSQMKGREELFERERHREPVPGWHSCDLACQ